MDKLKPILKHIYWVVFAAAIVLPTAGWWMASSDISAATEKAESAAESAFSGVPQSNSPNHSFGEAVQKFNTKLASENKRFNVYLWKTQSAEQNWPQSISADMKQIPYLGEIGISIRKRYRKSYFPQINNVPKIVDAYPENPLGKVAFDSGRFSPQVTRDDWKTEPPTSQAMWEAQEDVWLLRALLSAVAETNHGYNNILQAPVKEIETIVLRGGNAKALKEKASGAGSISEDAAGGAGEMDAMATAGGESRGLGSAGLRLGRGPASGMGANGGNNGAELNLDEIFGPDADTSTSGSSTTDTAGTPAAGAPDDPGGMMGGLMGGPAGRNNKQVRRYIDDEEEAPFKTRGFYIQVVMEHRKLSDLMVHLANLDWPVEILRVQLRMVNPDQFTYSEGGRGSGGMADMQPGMGRGGMRRGGLGNRNMRIPGLGRSGSGIEDPMGPMGPMGRGTTSTPDAKKAAKGAGMYEAGMKKPTLASVAIAGKFTIFQPPPKDDAATLAANTQPETPAGDAPPTDAVQPADGDGTTPASGTPAVEPKDNDEAAPTDPAKPTVSTGTATPTTPAKSPDGSQQPEPSTTAEPK